MRTLHKVKNLEIQKPKFTTRQLKTIYYLTRFYAGTGGAVIETSKYSGKQITRIFRADRYTTWRQSFTYHRWLDLDVPQDYEQLINWDLVRIINRS